MPTISLIYTVFNRAEHLHRSLQRLPTADEIIVVDDGSESQIDIEHVCKFWCAVGMPVKYVRNERPEWGNRSQPTNVGVKLAKYEYVLLTDPEVEFLSDVVEQFRDSAKFFPDNILAPWNGYHDVRADCALEDCFLACPGNGLHDNGGNAFLYKRSWIEEIGGYDETLEPGAWDDIDFHTRLAWNGHVQVPVPFVEIRHRWHDLIPWNAGDPAFQESSLRNKARVEAKRYPQDLVANVGREWGKII